jgi:hypothetical protein
MKIKAGHLGIAGAATFCTLYAIFALILRFFPTHTLKFIGMIHMMPKLDYIKPFITVTPQAILLGMLTHTIIVFFFFWFTATIYNLFQK